MTETIESKIRIQAPRDDVWGVLADVQGISKWAAPVSEAQVEGDPGEGATRHCTFADGGSIDERFTAWEDGRLRRYEITGDLPTSSLVSEWELSEEDGGTVVVYRAQFEPNEDVPAEAVAEELAGTGEFLTQALKTYGQGARAAGSVAEPPEDPTVTSRGASEPLNEGSWVA